MSRIGSAFSTADIISYSYNDRSEVTGAQSDNISSYSYGYSFDNIGNRLTASLASTDWTYSANNLNQYTSTSDGNNTYTPVYNADGCMTTYGDWTYTWNAENRLVSAISSDTKLEFTYDLG